MIIAFIVLLVITMTIVFLAIGEPELAVILIGLIITAGVFYGALFWFPEFLCREKVESQGYECRWGFFYGCQMNYKGQWIDYEKWRVMD